jgi:hypothetical protein
MEKLSYKNQAKQNKFQEKEPQLFDQFINIKNELNTSINNVEALVQQIETIAGQKNLDIPELKQAKTSAINLKRIINSEL